MGMLVKGHIAKALYSESTSAEMIVKFIVTLTGLDFSRHRVLLDSPVFTPEELEEW